MKILAIQNCRAEGFGLFEQYLSEHSIKHTIVHPYDGSPLPPLENYDAVMIGGTPLAAYKIDDYPFLKQEANYLRGVIESGKPCLGICFGAQILAYLLGARVYRNYKKEIGGYEVRLTAAGKKNPVLAGFPDTFPIFHWHGDTFDIPISAELLAEGDDCKNQMFCYRNVVGVQFHIEIIAADALNWSDEYAPELVQFGKSKSQIYSECLAIETQLKKLAYRLMGNWVEMSI
jgi:GMP synthase-like glutamine amidotransferase